MGNNSKFWLEKASRGRWPKQPSSDLWDISGQDGGIGEGTCMMIGRDSSKMGETPQE